MSIIQRHYKERYNNTIMDNLSPAELQKLQIENPDKIIIIKFSAEWCAPCKKIKLLWDEWINRVPADKFLCITVDIEESLDLFMTFKKKKIINTIPTLMAFYGSKFIDTVRNEWYLPDDLVGGSIEDVNDFFGRCLQKIEKETII